MNRLFLSLLAVFFVAGCQTLEDVPLDRATIFYDRATFPEKLQQDTGTLDEPILQHGRCTLYLATPGATVTTNFRFCIYALTEKHLLIQGWDAANTKYIPIMNVDLTKLTSVDLASFIRIKQVKLLEPQRQTGISAIIDNGGYIDQEATEQLFETIKARGIPSTGDSKLMRAPPAPSSAPMMIPIVIPRR